MHISILDDAGATARLALTGKLDIAGADVVALPLATLSGSKSGLLIDMSGVTFISSIGIRHLLSASRALMRRGGRLVLLKPNESVVGVLVAAGVSDLMTIVPAKPRQRPPCKDDHRSVERIGSKLRDAPYARRQTKPQRKVGTA